MMTVELVGPSITSREFAVTTLRVNSSTSSGMTSPKITISSQRRKELVDRIGNVRVLLLTTRKSVLSVIRHLEYSMWKHMHELLLTKHTLYKLLLSRLS